MTDITAAVSHTTDGVVLTIEVYAGAKRASFPSGYNEWRKAVGCSVQAPAKEGKANRDVVAIIADTLDIPRRNVRILSGETSSIKRILIEGVDPAELIRLLTAALDPS
ncbi:MAG: YggU family protein [Methanomicrobiales archaeon]|nr:YggU family protein [Methanomicrobiales archaeon]